MICPYCQTDNRDDRDSCYYCQKDLSMLHLIINKAKLCYNQGLEYAERDRFDEAIREMQNAIDLDASLVNAHVVLGTLYAKKGQFEEAQAVWTHALAQDHRYEKIHEYLNKSGPIQEVFPSIVRLKRAVRILISIVAGLAILIVLVITFSLGIMLMNRNNGNLLEKYMTDNTATQSQLNTSLAQAQTSLAQLQSATNEAQIQAQRREIWMVFSLLDLESPVLAGRVREWKTQAQWNDLVNHLLQIRLDEFNLQAQEQFNNSIGEDQIEDAKNTLARARHVYQIYDSAEPTWTLEAQRHLDTIARGQQWQNLLNTYHALDENNGDWANLLELISSFQTQYSDLDSTTSAQLDTIKADTEQALIKKEIAWLTANAPKLINSETISKTDAQRVLAIYEIAFSAVKEKTKDATTLLYVAALCAQILEQPDQARILLERLITDYPKADLVKKAKPFLEQLQTPEESIEN